MTWESEQHECVCQREFAAIHRDTVRRYVGLAEQNAGDGDRAGPPDGQNRPNPPAGSDDENRPNLPAGSGDQNQPNPPTGSGPSSKAKRFREEIIAGLERGLSCQRIWQDLKTEHDFDGAYDSVKRFARRLKEATPLPFRRMECEPGEEAQVDFGTGAPVFARETLSVSASPQLCLPQQTRPGRGDRGPARLLAATEGNDGRNLPLCEN